MCNLSQGIAQNAWNKGMKEGLMAGENKGKLAVVVNMLKGGKLTLSEIATYAGLSLDEVKSVAAKL